MGSPGEYKQYKPKVVKPTPEPTKEPMVATPTVQPGLIQDVDPTMTALTGGSSIGAGIGAGIKEDVWDPIAGGFGKLWNILQMPSDVSGALLNFGTLIGGMGPDPSVPTSMQAYVPPKNYDRDPLGKVEAVMDHYNEKENNFFNLLDFADSINEVNEIPEPLQAAAAITTDPLWMSPAKVRAVPLATGITKGLPGVTRIDKALEGKYLPFLGGFDWMKPFSNAGQGTNAASLAATKVIDDTLAEAEKLDTSLKAAGKETTTEVAGFTPKPKVKRIPVPDIPQVRSVIQKLKEAKPLSKAQKEAYSEERAARIGAFKREMNQAFEESGEWPDKEMFQELLEKHLSGEMKTVAWSPLMESAGPDAFTQADYDVITKYIAEFSGGPNYDYIANMQAWFALADGSTVPQPAQLKRLEKMFGTDLIEGFSEPLGKVDKAWAAAIDVLGLPRTVVASFDLSAPLRQGRALGAENPKEFQEAFATMHKVMFSEAGTVAVEESILNHKLYGYAEAGGLFFAERGGKSIAKEEAFVSNLASKWIPGVKISERAYTTFLNKFRHDVYFKTIEEWHASGVPKSLQDYKDLAAIINWGTGRGPNPFAFVKGSGSNKVADLFNVAFFAPRFTSAGPSFLVGGAIKSGRNEAVSKVWASNAASFMQSSIMWLRFMDMAGAEIEMNPASSDFGKGKMGQHRFDFFGGYLPLARYFYQTTTGKRKSLGTGQTYDIERHEPLMRWIESKLSPTGAAGLDTFTGEDFLGETVDWGSVDGLTNELKDRLVPMIIGDFMEAMEQYESPYEMLHNPAVPLGLAFSIYGGGFQSFTTTKDLKDQVTNQIWPTLVYDDLAIGSQQKHRVDNHPVIKDHFEELASKRPTVTGKDAWMSGIKDWADANTRLLEEGMEEGTPGYITLINQQGPGKQQRQFIQEFNDARWYNWIFNIPPSAEEWNNSKKLDHIQKVVDESKSQAAIFRDKYWSISAPMMLIDVDNSGLYVDMQDFDYQKEKRSEVIRDAMNLGVVRTLYDENGKAYPDPSDENLDIIIGKRPIYTEDETDPEKLKFQQTLDEYSADSEFLGEHFFAQDRNYFKKNYPDNSEIMYKEYVKYLVNKSTALDQASEDGITKYNYKEMTTGVNAFRKNARSIGWEGEVVPPEIKERAKEITRLLIKWGYLRLDDGSIPSELKAVLNAEFMPQQLETVEQFIR